MRLLDRTGELDAMSPLVHDDPAAIPDGLGRLVVHLHLDRRAARVDDLDRPMPADVLVVHGQPGAEQEQGDDAHHGPA